MLIQGAPFRTVSNKTMWFLYLQGGSLSVVNGVITPISRGIFIIPVTHL